MRRIFTRRRLAIGCFFTALISVVVLIVLALIGPSKTHWRYHSLSSNAVAGHPEYCNYFVTDKRIVRLAYIPYLVPERIGRRIDPNNWRREQMSAYFMELGIIVIPEFNFEMTRDGGSSYTQFWQFENLDSSFPTCDKFGVLDEVNFWVWAGMSLAVTHDAGATWLVQEVNVETWVEYYGDSYITEVEFTTSDRGLLVFQERGKSQDFVPALLTDDGGATWYADPNWVNPNE